MFVARKINAFLVRLDDPPGDKRRARLFMRIQMRRKELRLRTDVIVEEQHEFVFCRKQRAIHGFRNGRRLELYPADGALRVQTFQSAANRFCMLFSLVDNDDFVRRGGKGEE